MFKKIVAAILSLTLLVSFAACSSGKSGEGKVEKITFVLDWTPNTNHTGVYVAQKLGYFEEAGIEVNIVQPPEDGATSLVASGNAQFGVDFQDSIAPAFGTEEPLPVTAVAAILQHNTSGIISLKGNGIDRPKGLEGKTYATWNAPIEKAMLQNVVEGDGGDFSKVNLRPSTVNDVIAGLQTDVDAVWIYYAWDGIATEVKGVETDYFSFRDLNPVFDYYTPILVANNSFLSEKPETAKKFLKAVQQGYEYAISHPEEAADILLEVAPELDRDITVASQKWIADQYKAEAEQWGIIDPSRWNAFYNWLNENGLVEQAIPENFGFTNDYLAG
ncbi:NMT1/THI5-like protein [[Clostridium] methylpentosum DSM 5476]|uniref:NMT1/THI5-like protein n=1 Tax=[Clostridium] methylpentosum DSM 5476 TaxID=537013 RepID=C0ECX0_9FIRM|nr:NMT1/THI5-like protein [[Clostridium] methylpentosum DSM 5476]MDY3990223.1 ABC transporter substrate-binding protein [Massilioclostridium sp.]MEE1491076.1 ABC transporter substrate-binding protein [Massilioclostridium sp.]